jgi:membrane peptidoglycan carboxypeptidase
MGPGRRGPGGPGGPGGPRGRRPGIGPGGRRIKRKGDWWRYWTWKKALGVASATAGLFILIIVGGVLYLYNSTPIPTQELAADTYQNSTVYFSDGKTPIGTYGDIHRQILTYNQIPHILDDAVMAAEDRSFMTEGGISPTGIMRAAWDDVTGNSSSLSGGSTITQEFVRQYYEGIGTQQTASRKIKEIFVAMKISKDKSKQWILTNYLNTIYLGQGSYGVAAAAQTYFNEPVSKLTVAQAAVIAAIIQQPTNFPLPQYRPELQTRWHYVLSGMVKMGDLTAQQAAAMKFPAMSDTPMQAAGPNAWDPYIVAEVKGELEQVDHYTEQQIDTEGLKIVTTISPQDENQLYQAVDYNIGQIKAQGFMLPPYAMIGAEEQNPINGDILAIYGGPGMNLSAKQCAGTCQLNATLQTEQVGSSFKPYVVSAAVNEGMNVQTSELNANARLWVPPFSLGSTLSSTTPMPASEGYFPVHNDSFENIAGAQANGGTTVQNALAQSSNTAFTDLAHRVGLTQIEQMAESEGDVDPAAFASEHGVGIALGIDSLTVNNQATMVSTIDDNGLYHLPHMVASIIKPNGTVTDPAVPSHQSLTPAQDSQVQYAMLKTVVNGTATAAAMNDGRPIIGKTGTTTSSKSAFFVGAIPQYSLAVGIYVVKPDDPNEALTALGGGGFGGAWPAAIWHTFAENMWSNLPAQNFLNPQFSGQAWIQVLQAPKAPPTKPAPGGPGRRHRPFPTAPPGFGSSPPPVTFSPSPPPSLFPSPSASSSIPPFLPGNKGNGKGGS